MEEEYSFTIIDEPAKIIQIDDFTSYTLLIERDSVNDNYFENLVIHVDSSDFVEAFIIKYNLYSQPQLIHEHNSYSIDAYTELTPINFNDDEAKVQYTASDGCSIVTLMCPYQGDHPAGSSCIAADRGDLYWSTDSSNCSGGGGDGISTGGGGGTSGGNSYNGGGHGGSGGGSVTTSPVTGSMEYQIIKNFKKQLNTQQLQWWNNTINQASVQLIHNYLLQVDADPVLAEELIDLAIEYLNTYGDSAENQSFISSIINDILHPENDGVEPENVDIDPNCESFNFQQTSSNWQESAVTNIHFQVIIVSPGGLTVNHVVEFPQPILFGCPINLSIGDTYISHGLAANVSAQALEQSMDETVKKFGNKSVTSMVVELYFKQRLKHNYPLFIPGARVNFNPSSYSVTPTPYQSSFGNGDCN